MELRLTGPSTALALLLASQGWAQEHHHPSVADDPAEHADHASSMQGRLGPYAAGREASGTSWQPDSTPHRGLHFERGAWTLMAHGLVDLVWDDQGGPRGDEEFFSGNMAMLMARRPIGAGTLGLRGMVSLDPATIGEEGYPLLLQTGETADGVHTLVDRQHPHDFFMELGATYSVPLSARSSVFGYLAFPGEPALGPPVFMHRFSGEELPQAPISHHWLDSTHITFGVATAGVVLDGFKIEGSVFTGREPDAERWNFDQPRFDSHSLRLSWNPTPDWALQVSGGRLESPEELHPDVDTDRATASVSYNRRLSPRTLSQTTLAWGRNHNRPGETLDAVLLEAAVVRDERHVFFGRLERAEKDELFEHDEPLAGRVFDVGAATVGYRYDWTLGRQLTLGLGGLLTGYDLERELQGEYGQHPLSFMFSSRLRLR
jgi:hypothetical protein